MDSPGRLPAAALISLFLLWPEFARAGEIKQFFPCDLDKLNASICGQVLDFTDNHGCDRRLWSKSLDLPRDLYVYVPPNYDPEKSYPLMLWLHGFGGDESQFCRQVVRALDEAIVSGAMPPVIAAAPDGSCPKRHEFWCPGSWYINSERGNWEDYIVEDVLGFLDQQFKIRPERDAHIIAGWSMGGFGAYNLAFKHPDRFRVLVGIYPNLNLRYADCDGHWGTDFSPETCAWLEDLKPRWLIGQYPKYRFPVPAWVVYRPVWGSGRECIERMSQENPIELLDRLDIQDGQFDMFVAYGQCDEYNVDAQVDSFLYHARQRGLNFWVRFNPEGHHSTEYVNECMPDVLAAVGAQLRQLLPELNAVRNEKAASSASAEPDAPAARKQRMSESNDSAAELPGATLIVPRLIAGSVQPPGVSKSCCSRTASSGGNR